MQRAGSGASWSCRNRSRTPADPRLKTTSIRRVWGLRVPLLLQDGEVDGEERLGHGGSGRGALRPRELTTVATVARSGLARARAR
jgi:hypothetical protein